VIASGPRDVAVSVMQPTPFTAATSWQGRARAASDALDDGSWWSTLHANAHRCDTDAQETKCTGCCGRSSGSREPTARGGTGGGGVRPAAFFLGSEVYAKPGRRPTTSLLIWVSFDGTIKAALRCWSSSASSR